ncbi:MAG: T9SS type A sorting domain-containing protein [Taibaiella sp.]|nr:T9SS type A sorting domain-containing protein [Taibaiella sp.]
MTNDITIGAVWVSDAGGCPNTSFRKIRVADDLAQSLFDNNFQTIEGPEAPRMVVRALDRKLVFYLANDPISNNYQEKYGYDLSEAKYRVVSPKAANYVKSPDSLYKFEGYRVFQLRSRYVTAADIFAEDGTVDNSVAIEVFKCDIRNGVTRVINYEKNTDVSDTTYVPVIKVEGDDSGIRHSFEISQDAFAEGEEKRLVNYKNYYFVAVAYAHNNFAPFNAKRADSTQDLAYLESSKGAGGSPIAVVTGTPNPANGDMGTVLNAAYGDGVIIKRIEGAGNGANALTMSDSSENQAVFGVPAAGGGTLHQALQPTYKAGNGPVTVKVVDPVKLKPYDFELYLVSNDTTSQMKADSTSWKLVNLTTGDVIYSERNLQTANEQVIEDYGFSVAIGQAPRPSDSQDLRRNGMLYNDVIFSDPSNPWLAGVSDQEDRSYLNWIRSGNKTDTFRLCNFEDIKGDSAGQYYEKLLERYSTTLGTWAPWALAAKDSSTACGFGVARNGHSVALTALPSVDIVITKDKSKWTRSVVFEMNEEPLLAEGRVDKFSVRSHQSWNMDVDASGRPVYSTIEGDTGYSWFPGYAINQETGERLNIYFGEDSYLKVHNGDDMIWNPTSTILEGTGGNIAVVFGGKHYIYIENSRYDSGRAFVAAISHPSDFIRQARFNKMAWVGVPLLNYLTNAKLTSLNDGLIPNDVRISFKVSRPYTKYNTDINNNGTLRNNGFPLYYFSTKDIAPIKLADNANADKDALLDRIHAVPNPYYGYTGYELNRYDTRIKIINLPQRATVSVYSLDGTLVRRLEKDNANQSFVDWDIRNAKGLPIASGMYLIHVNAEGIGEKVIRWFGAMRPIDITNY